MGGRVRGGLVAMENGRLPVTVGTSTCHPLHTTARRILSSMSQQLKVEK